MAVETSSLIRSSRNSLELAVLGRGLSYRDFLPVIKFTYSDSRQINTFAPDSDSLRLGVNLSQPLFNGGRTLKSLESGDAGIETAKAALEESIRKVSDESWRLYHELLLTSEKLGLQRELLGISRRQLEVAEEKLSMGIITELDHLESLIEISNLETEILDTENDLRSRSDDFTALIGLEPGFAASEELNLTGSIDREYPGLRLFIEDRPHYASLGRRRNPDLQRMRLELKQLKSKLEIIQCSWIPRLSLETSLSAGGGSFPLQHPDCSFSLKIDFPFSPLPSDITAGGGMRSERQNSSVVSGGVGILPDASFILDEKSAALRLRQAAESLAERQLSLEQDIASALEDLDHLRRRLGNSRETLKLLERRLILMETMNSIGEITELELLDARTRYFEQEISIREAVFELLLHERKFERLTGLDPGELQNISVKIEGGVPDAR